LARPGRCDRPPARDRRLSWPGRVDATDSQRFEQVVAETDGVDDVQRKERNPAEQKHAYAYTTTHLRIHKVTVT